MKIRTIAVAIVVSLALTAARAQVNDILQITETGENFNDLVATFNGAPLSVNLTGAADGWTVELPSGFSFQNSAVGTAYIIGEPENNLFGNTIAITQPTFLTWTSEDPTVVSALLGPFTVTNAGNGPTGGFFDLVVDDNPGRTVPDTSSTLILLGMSLAGLACFAKIRRSAA
jgi:hypothetical protein